MEPWTPERAPSITNPSRLATMPSMGSDMATRVTRMTTVLVSSLRELEPDWEAADADVLDQHRDVPLDDER